MPSVPVSLMSLWLKLMEICKNNTSVFRTLILVNSLPFIVLFKLEKFVMDRRKYLKRIAKCAVQIVTA